MVSEIRERIEIEEYGLGFLLSLREEGDVALGFVQSGLKDLLAWLGSEGYDVG